MTRMSKLATGKNDRKQEILTPKPITDFVRLVFGGKIALDPCSAGPGFNFSTVQSVDYMCGSDKGGRDGLVEPWEDATFCNPPFKDLKKWLAKAGFEAASSDFDCQVLGTPRKRIVVLCPNRTNRTWFRAARDEARAAGFVLELNPVTFVGYTGTFPVPCVLLAFNVHSPGYGFTGEAYLAGKALGAYL